MADQASRDPYALMFDKQRDAVTGGHKRIAIVCGRRAGKTLAFVLLALRVMQKYPGCRIPYIALTRSSAEGIVWEVIREINEKLGLGLEERISTLSWRGANGSEIFLVGGNKTDEIEKVRGRKFPLVGIDEAASFRSTLLKTLIKDVLTLALMDMRGTLVMVGTPSAACVGEFYEATTGKLPGWHTAHWDARDNPHIPHAEEYFAELCGQYGWSEDDPEYRRECLGLWERDTDALVYKWNADRNGDDAMPDDYHPGAKGWGHVLAMDYGYVDSCAWVVLAFRVGRNTGGDKRVWVVESRRRSTLLDDERAEMAADLAALGVVPMEDHREENAGLLPDEVGWMTYRFWAKYRPMKTVGDAGGLGKPYVEEARRRWRIPVEPADKARKSAQIELVNGALRTGSLRVIVPSNSDLIGEAEILQWNMEKVAVTAGGLVRHELRRVIDERFEDHLCDGLQYGFGAVRAYINEAPADKPPPDQSRDGLDDAMDAPRKKRAEAGWLAGRKQSKRNANWARGR